jgi:hypothetical protein
LKSSHNKYNEEIYLQNYEGRTFRKAITRPYTFDELKRVKDLMDEYFKSKQIKKVKTTRRYFENLANEISGFKNSVPERVRVTKSYLANLYFYQKDPKYKNLSEKARSEKVTSKNSRIIDAIFKFLQDYIERKSTIPEDSSVAVTELVIGDWKPKVNLHFPQGADYYAIPLKNGALKRLACNVISSSKYYRFGFKFLLKGGAIFGDTTIKSLDHNLIVHTGRTSIIDIQRSDLIFCLYTNGVRIIDEFIDVEYKDNYLCELVIDDESFLQFLINGKIIKNVFISEKIQGRVYMLAWADHNEYDLEIKNIKVEAKNG